MYESPITILIDDITKQIQIQQEDGIYKAVCNYGISVDKDELIRALRYDREQYEEGFCDGYEARDKEIVRCRYCEHSEPTGYDEYCVWCKNMLCEMSVNGFCSEGKRRADNAAD